LARSIATYYLPADTKLVHSVEDLKCIHKKRN
jgi:hypothetical protein